MAKTIAVALRLTMLTLVVTGFIYPFVITAIAQLVFPYRASGSVIEHGSELIGQAFTSPRYLQGRPSASGYDATASGGSNLGPTSAKLRARVIDEMAVLRAANPDAPTVIPADLVTASASGLDPDVSIDAAMWQVPRIARARGIAEERIRAAIATAIQGRSFGILGEPRVNVLKANLALDGISSQSTVNSPQSTIRRL
jgi:K+-transporting ATPase ATPase C chain